MTVQGMKMALTLASPILSATPVSPKWICPLSFNSNGSGCWTLKQISVLTSHKSSSYHLYAFRKPLRLVAHRTIPLAEPRVGGSHPAFRGAEGGGACWRRGSACGDRGEEWLWEASREEGCASAGWW